MVSARTVLRGALTRYFPTSLALMGVGLAPLMLAGVRMHPWAPLIALTQVVGGTLGFASVLLLTRRRLSADAPIAGRPTVVAGVVAPIVNMLSLMFLVFPAKSRALDIAACAVGGGILALAMFFPWFASTTVAVIDPHEEALLTEGNPHAESRARHRALNDELVDAR